MDFDKNAALARLGSLSRLKLAQIWAVSPAAHTLLTEDIRVLLGLAPGESEPAPMNSKPPQRAGFLVGNHQVEQW